MGIFVIGLWRIAILPEKTIRMIKMMKSIVPTSNDDFVFTYDGHPFDCSYIDYHLKDVLSKNGIDCRERNISFHSTRYTYDTLMNREISGDDLRLMIGHTSKRMTDYYDKSKVTDHLPELLSNKIVIDSVFN